MFSPGRVVCVIAASTLVACGGGGGGSGDSNSRATAAEVTIEGEALDVLGTALVVDASPAPTEATPTTGDTATPEAPASPPPSTTSTTSGSTLDTAAAAPVTRSVRSEDILIAARANRSTETGAGRLQCMGQNVTSASVSSGLYGTGSSGLTELKHGLVDSASVKAFHFTIWQGDPSTSGINTQRCERYFGATDQSIPRGSDVWFGVKAKVSEWASGTNRIIWQWHENSDASGLSPHLAAIVNGRTLRIVAHYNNATTLSRETTTSVVLYSTTQWKPEVWNEFVVKAKVDPDPSGSGYVDLWLNGTRVAQYRGGIGYRYDAPRDYAKFGPYHWNTATNKWQPGDVDTVRASYTGMVLVKHATGYTYDSIRQMLN